MAEMYDRLLAPVGIQPNDQILDVGAWRGPIWETVRSRLGPRGRVVLLDRSLADLAAARTAHAADDRLQAVGGDATALPVKAASVRAVTTRSVLIYVRDKARALREFHRVLLPAGWVCLCEPIPSQIEETERFAWGPWEPIHTAIQELRLAAWRQPLFQAGMECTEERLLSLLAEAGFREIQRQRERVPKLEYGSAEAVLRMWKPPHLGQDGYEPWEQQLGKRFSSTVIREFARFVSQAVEEGQFRVTLPLVFLWGRKAEQRPLV
jgi:ubiquinone/menaquinone biosynthesis C-methylase UbiE